MYQSEVSVGSVVSTECLVISSRLVLIKSASVSHKKLYSTI